MPWKGFWAARVWRSGPSSRGDLPDVQRASLRELYAHMEWADAKVWSGILRSDWARPYYPDVVEDRFGQAPLNGICTYIEVSDTGAGNRRGHSGQDVGPVLFKRNDRPRARSGGRPGRRPITWWSDPGPKPSGSWNRS